MKKLISGFLIGLTIGFIVGVFLLRQNKPTPVITVNPLPEIERQADLVVTVRQSGKLSGQTKIPIVKKAQDALDSKQTFEGNPSSESKKSIQGDSEPFIVVVPVAGEVESVFIDKRTGEELGRGTTSVKGETIMTVGETVQVETVFKDELKFSIDVPSQPLKRNEVGIIYDRDWIVYYKRELANIGPASLWTEVSYDFDDDDLKLAVGASVKW